MGVRERLPNLVVEGFKSEERPLVTYLQDHLAGALHAIELLKAMCQHFAGEPLGTFAGEKCCRG